MSTRNIGIMFARLFAIYLAMQAVLILSHFLLGALDRIGYFFSKGTFNWLINNGIRVMVPALFAAIVWKYAALVVPKNDDAGGSDELPQDLMYVGVSLMGLYFLFLGTVGLAQAASQSIVKSMGNSVFGTNSDFIFASTLILLAPYMIQAIVGLGLLLGRRRISSLLLKARYVGTGAT